MPQELTDFQIATGAARPEDAVRRFPCRQCGAGLSFAPGQTALECPYCGHKETIPVTEAQIAEIREHDLIAALERLPHTEGWGTERRTIQCNNCGAVTAFEPGQVAGSCAFCGSAKVSERPGAANLIRPESLIPFQIPKEKATQLFRQWIGSRFWAPRSLKQLAELAKINGAYLPFWTFDALTSAHWTAEAGYYYYETEYYTETDSEGRTVQRERQVQKIRWEPASGFRQDFFDDELVCASTGLPGRLLAGIVPYDLTKLAPYEAAFLSGFSAEEYQIDLRQAWAQGQEQIERKVYQLCAGDVPGDTHRNLHVDAAFSQLTYKHLLLPVWIAAYLYGNRTWRFLVNGQTGRCSGEAPVSPWKVAAAVAIALIVALVIFFLIRGGGG